MSNFHQNTHSLWQKETSSLKKPQALEVNLDTDVCIVGAGIAGLTTAYLLVKQGIQVVVLDKESFGENETGHSTAHLSNAIDDGYKNILRWHGEETGHLLYESHSAAIDFIESTVLEETIECDFRRVPGYLFLAPGHNRRRLEEELQAAKTIGFNEVELVEFIPGIHKIPGPALRFPRQAQCNPLRYTKGLLKKITELGGQVFFNTQATQIQGGLDSYVTTSSGFEVACKNIVVATNVPVNDWVTMHTKQYAYRSYVIASKFPRENLNPMLIWDTQDPYHFVRTYEDPKSKELLLIVGGEDHRVGQWTNPEEKYIRLQEWARTHFHFNPEVVFRWSGQIIEPMDGVAYIGLNPGDDNVFIATGDSGHGITHGTIAGLILSDLVQKKDHPWAKIYSPSRFNLKSIGNFARGTINMTSQYTDWLKKMPSSALAKTPSEEGVVVREGLRPVAIYKDEQGQTHKFSAVCSHLGGVVHWNSSEKTWDCPCHGSRFSKMGEVLNGPAISDLAPFVEHQNIYQQQKLPEIEKEP